MKYFTKLLVLCALVAAPVIAADFFPSAGDHAAEMYVLGMPKEAEAVAAKMQKALAADPQWIQTYLKEKNPKPGEILPYNEKFGITKEEYDLFIRATKSMTLNKVADVVVNVAKSKDKVTILINVPTLPVRQFEFTPAGEEMSCSLGSAKQHTEINQTNADAPTGKWNGFQWTLEQGTPAVQSQTDWWGLKFAIGHDEFSRELIYLDIKGQKQGKSLLASVLVRWSEK
jgi:hypothetical protein